MTFSYTGSDPVRRIPRRTELSQLPGFDLHAQYYSARTGGDFFDALVIGSRMLFLLTDIAGKTPEAHTIAAEVQDVFRQSSAEIFGTSDINLMDATTTLIQRVNHALISAANGVRFAPTFIGCFDLNLGVLAYINAGGQPAVFRDSDETRLLPNVSVPLGLFTHLTFEPSIQAFEPGAKLLIVTTGVVEVDHLRTQFGVDRIVRLLQDSTSVSAREITRTTLEAAHDFKKLPWYSIQRLLRRTHRREEDLTALAIVRPLQP